MNSAQYIDSNEKLDQFCAALKTCSWIAVDSEFIREKTYYPELALIQIASEHEIACIDPYAINNFQPMLELFNNASIVKVFHSPSQDLELFAHFFNELPQNIFDTQLAASILGIGNQIGYADLIHKLCNVQLDKIHTRCDWCKRPLSESELNYALDDVRYLGDAYQQLLNKLNKTGRINWLQQDFIALSQIENYQTDWDNLWKKLKGIQKLKGNALHYANQLCRWREQLAQDKNKPKRWILKDEDIIDIARLKPSTKAAFSAIRSLNENFIKQHANAIIQLLKQADTMDRALWPKPEKFKSLSDNQQAKSDCLMAICRRNAQQNDMALATLANKKDIDNLVLGKTSKLIQGWRLEMAGKQCQHFLEGSLSINVNQEGIITFCD